MSEHDLLEVVEIEQICELSPWGWDSYHRELGAGDQVIMLVARVTAPRVLAIDDKEVAGFLVSRIAADELHVNNVAVRPGCRGRGIGNRLLTAALARGTRRGLRAAFLEVRASNSAAQQLYKSCGFRVSGRRRRYYNHPVEDALIMTVGL